VFFSYLLGKWLISILFFGHLFFVLSLVSLVSLIFLGFIGDLILFRKKKLFTLQLLISLFQIILYSLIFFLFLCINLWLITIGLFLFLGLLVMKYIRLIIVIKSFRFCRKDSTTYYIRFRPYSL